MSKSECQAAPKTQAWRDEAAPRSECPDDGGQKQAIAFGHSSFGLLSSFGFRHSGFSGRILEAPYTQAHGSHGHTLEAADLLPAHLLDGDEIVILAIKPSLWFVIFVSFRWLVATILLILAAGWVANLVPQVNAPMIIKAAVILAAGRIGLAVLQWVSRLYVLTNRRIMRLTGILNVDLFECPLTKIQNTFLTLSWYERLTGLGTISFATAGTGGVEASWLHVNNPLELHERVRSAIHRAQRPGGSGI